jgi:hypothetical protein
MMTSLTILHVHNFMKVGLKSGRVEGSGQAREEGQDLGPGL